MGTALSADWRRPERSSTHLRMFACPASSKTLAARLNVVFDSSAKVATGLRNRRGWRWLGTLPHAAFGCSVVQRPWDRLWICVTEFEIARLDGAHSEEGSRWEGWNRGLAVFREHYRLAVCSFFCPNLALTNSLCPVRVADGRVRATEAKSRTQAGPESNDEANGGGWEFDEQTGYVIEKSANGASGMYDDHRRAQPEAASIGRGSRTRCRSR